MPAAARTVRVQAVAGERLVYLVESWSEPEHPQRVDLLAHLGRGECSCKNWQTKRWPMIRDKLPELRYGEPGSSVCRHVEVARLKYLREHLEDLARRLEGQT
jgi:hypothetical protein